MSSYALGVPMKSRLVLDDCRRALELTEDATTEQDFRVHWVALVALLRAVGHVLAKVDAASSPAIGNAVSKIWNQWKQSRSEHQVFWDFIEVERNSVLKAYQLGIQPDEVPVAVHDEGTPQLFTLDECIYKPLLTGPYAGEDGRDVARDAIDWWEQQLAEVAESVA